MEMVATTGTIRHAELQSNITTNKPTPNFLQSGCLSCRQTNSVKSLKSKNNMATLSRLRQRQLDSEYENVILNDA